MSSSKSRARRQAEKQYRERLNALRKIGAYNPNGTELTAYRKKRINAAWREYAPYLDNPQRRPYFFVPAPPANKKRFLAQADALDIKTTPTGILYAKGGHTRAAVKYDVKRGEYDLILTGKVKRGERRGKKYEDRLAIAPLDRINNERERIRDQAANFGALKRGEQIGFVLVENNREMGASRSTFHTVDQLMNYIDQNYHRDNRAARLAFLRLIVVRKTTLVDWERPNKRMARKNTWAVFNTVEEEIVASGYSTKLKASKVAAALTRSTGEKHIAIPDK